MQERFEQLWTIAIKRAESGDLEAIIAACEVLDSWARFIASCLASVSQSSDDLRRREESNDKSLDAQDQRK